MTLIVWQLAVFFSVIHHLAKKVPQHPDTALGVIPSILFGNIACAAYLLVKGCPYVGWWGLLAHLNMVIVYSSDMHCLKVRWQPRHYWL